MAKRAGKFTAMRQYRLLFVCMGNICRSPAGEAVMRHLIEAEGLADRIECDSAGTIAFHTGNPPDHRMHTAAANRNINTGGQARQICDDDYRSFHPRFMEAPLQKDFAALPIVDGAKKQQEIDAETKVRPLKLVG